MFVDPMPRVSMSRYPNMMRRKPDGERESYYSIMVLCPCCHEYNAVGHITGRRGHWTAHYHERGRWSRSRRMRRKFATVAEAKRAILSATGHPPYMFPAQRSKKEN